MRNTKPEENNNLIKKYWVFALIGLLSGAFACFVINHRFTFAWPVTWVSTNEPVTVLGDCVTQVIFRDKYAEEYAGNTSYPTLEVGDCVRFASSWKKDGSHYTVHFLWGEGKTQQVGIDSYSKDKDGNPTGGDVYLRGELVKVKCN